MPETQPSETSNGKADHSRRPADARISTAYVPRTGKWLFIGVVSLVLLLGVGFIFAYLVREHDNLAADRLTTDAADAKATLNVVSVHSTPNSYPLTLPGETAGWYQSTIYARVDGYVGSWSADIGDHVKQGQVLAVIDTPELDQQLSAARAKAHASDEQVKVVESDVSIAKLTYERWRDSPTGVVSDQEREEKKATYNSAVARLAEAQAQAQLDQADVGKFVAMEAFRKVTAPYDGVITERRIDIGDLISAGSGASTTPLYSIAQSNTIRVFVDVPQKASAEMAVGLPAYATSNQFANRLFRGKVARSSMSVDPRTRTQRTEVDIPNADLSLVPGMYVQVTFELNQHGLLEVPAAAILFRPSGLAVAVVNADNTVEFHPVTVAKDNGDTVELASGVALGDRVALNISSAVEPGEQVNVVENDQDHQPTGPALANDQVGKH